MDDKDTFKDINSMRYSILSANVLALPGSLFSGFFIYLILSYFLVPFRITVPLSVIMSFIIFGLTSYYSNEKVNHSGIENKIFRGKFHSNLFFVIAYTILIISSYFYNQNTNMLFIPWEQFTEVQLINLGIAISLSIFMPGYALVSIFDRKDELKILPKFLVAYILSALVTGLTGFICGSLGVAVSNIKPILIGIHVVILILFILDIILKKDFQYHGFQPNVSFGILKQNSSIILVFASLFALIILSTYYLFNGVIVGDQWFYHGKSLVFSSGAYKDFTTLRIDELYPPFLPAFLAAFSTLSGAPSVNSYVSINFLNIIPVLAFYYFFTRWIPNHRKAALLASTLFMLSSGFGWKYVLSLANTHPITTLGSSIEILYQGSARTYDIWTPNTFINAAHPDITTALVIFALPAGFVLLGLIKENMNSKLRHFAILLGVLSLGYLAHDEFGLFIIVACILPFIFKLNSSHYLFAAILTTLLLVILDINFLYGTYFSHELIPRIPFIALFLLFVSIMWILYASKILQRVHNIKPFTNRMKIIFNQKTKIIIGITIIVIFSYLYIFSFIVWDSTPTFDVHHNTNGLRVVPLYFYPLRLGVTGLLGFAFLLSLIFKKYEREVFVLGIIGIVAFFTGPYYNEERFNKYIMVAMAGFASLLLLKILTLQSFLKPLRNGLIIGLVLTLSSLSILMFIGYNALGLETPNNVHFNQDLPLKHFPSDINLLNFLHNNINIKTDSIALTENQTSRYSGMTSELEGFVGLPLTRPTASPDILRATSLEGFYSLLDYNNMKYIILPKNEIKQGTSEITHFVLENFKKSYEDETYVALSIPPLSPPSPGGNVTMLFQNNQYPLNHVQFFYNAISDYHTGFFVSNTSKFNQTTKNAVLDGTKTMWFNLPTKNVNYVEDRFRIINEHKDDNHSGIVWDDNGIEHYAFIRSDKITFYTADKGEAGSTPIVREKGLWYTLKIAYIDSSIEVFVNDELKLQIPKSPSYIPNLSKVGIRSFNTDTEFEPLKIGMAEPVNYDLKYNYYYPLSALALSNIKYETLLEQDFSAFSKKIVIITHDPLNNNRYLEFVKSGGTIFVLNSDYDFNGEFSKILSIKLGNETKFDSIENSNGHHLTVPGITRDIKINTSDAVMSFYVNNGQHVAPFSIEKKYGNGKIVFVNAAGYFKSISQSPDQFFSTLANIPGLLDLNSDEYQKDLSNKMQIPRFVGDLEAKGQVLIKGSSVVLPEDEFDLLTPVQNNSNYVKIHNLKLYGPFDVIINSTNLLYVPSSEYGYIKLDLDRFNLTIKLANGSSAQFLVGDSNQTSKVTSGIVQFKGVKIQPTQVENIILMRNPEIIINGTTTFQELHSVDPHDPLLSWADAIPVTIVGSLIIDLDHIDNDLGNQGGAVTYFKFKSIDNIPKANSQ